MWSSKDLPSLGTTHFLVHRPGTWESPQRGVGLKGLGKGNQLCILDSSHEGSLCHITDWHIRCWWRPLWWHTSARTTTSCVLVTPEECRPHGPFLSVSVEDISAAARWASPHTVVSLLPQWDCALTGTQSFVWALSFKLTFRVDVRLKHVGWWVVGFVADYSSHTRCPVVTRVNPDFWKLSKAGQSARVHLGLNELYFNVRQTDNVL